MSPLSGRTAGASRGRRRSVARLLTLSTSGPHTPGPDGSLDNVSLAYRDLRAAILWGQVPPGSLISERAVAERLGLSRTPVRSALHRLEQEGFITAHGRGRERRLIAAPLTLADGQELLSIVGHLEGLAARTAALLPPPRRRSLVTELRALNRALGGGRSHARDTGHYFDLDLAFHRAYVEGVVGPRLLTLHRAIKPQSERYTRLYASILLDVIPTSVKEHEAIARAIAAGDPDAAQEAAETNWRNAAQRLGRIIAQHGERGSWQVWRGRDGAGRDGARSR
jgi:DNA-binding GntR family transcriptional regulator